MSKKTLLTIAKVLLTTGLVWGLAALWYWAIKGMSLEIFIAHLITVLTILFVSMLLLMYVSGYYD